MQRERFETVARDLEERISKSGIAPVEIKFSDYFEGGELELLREMKFDSDIIGGLFDIGLEDRG